MATVKCDNCGAVMRQNAKKPIAFCPYCGYSVKLPESSTDFERFKMEHNEEVRRRKFVEERLVEKENNKSINRLFIGIAVALVFSMGLIFYLAYAPKNKLENQVKKVQQLIADGDYETALIEAQSIRKDKDGLFDSEPAYWDNQRKDLIKLIETEKRKHEAEINAQAAAPEGNASYLIGLDFEIVRDKFVQAGFKSIQLRTTNESNSDSDNNTVTQVTISGDTEWSYGIGGMLRKTYNVNAPVIITYNSVK